jgi:hypothetical protein
MRCLVAAGIEVATGELLRTMETVEGERLRCSASILSVAGLSASGRFFFPVIGLHGTDVQDIAIVVHPWLDLRTVTRMVYESLPRSSIVKITK